MRVGVRRGAEITVSQPFLNLFHGYAVCQHQAGAGVAKVMEPKIDGYTANKEYKISTLAADG